MQSSSSRLAAILAVVFSITVSGQFVRAQVAQDRITQAINDSALTPLKGNVHPLANANNDLGAAPVSQPMNHIKLVLQRSAAQEAALDGFLSSVQNKNSPNYHKWLTPAQFGKLYGPSDNDVAKLTGWLQANGFNVNTVPAGRTFIDFSGSVAQVQSAFHTSIHSYRANGVDFIANAKDPEIPAALSAVVAGVAHLNTIPLKPMHVQGSPAKFDGQTRKFTPVSGKYGPRSQYTANLNGSNYLVTVPADAATIYNTPNSKLNGNFSGATTYDGTGVTIGIAGQSSIDPTFVANYRTLFLGDSNTPIISNIDGVGDVPGDDDESYLDNEISGGLAPGATIHFYTESATTGNGVLGAAEQAISDNTVDILGVSYGTCELDAGTAGNQEINTDWQQAAAQGITVVVSAGDNGSAGCDATTDSNGNNVSSASGPIAVNGLASTPYNVAVGGTDYDTLANNFGSYVSTNTGSATNFYRTANKYIPEDTWNDSVATNGAVAQNVPIYIATGNPSDANISAGSGGQSNCAVNTTTNTAEGTCTSGYAKPSWQTGPGVPNDNVRDIPDVSFLSGDGAYGALWAVCDNSTAGFDSAGNTGTATCVANSGGDFFTDGFGGTSTAAPAFAGILALVVQKTGQRQGQAASILYSLYNSTPSIFHDVTTGNNSVPCSLTTTTTATCVQDSQGYDFEIGFDTNTGYDLATGLGSVDATALVTNWTSASGSLAVANVVSTPSATSIVPSDPLTFTVTVTTLSGAVVPTGSVTVSDGTYTSAATALANGAAMVTIPANSITATGNDTFTTTYTPATGVAIAPASSFAVVDITPVTPPTGTIAVTATTATISSPGQSGSSTVTVSPSGGYVGTVALTCTLASAPSGAAAAYNPACALTASSVMITSAAVTTTATFSSTASTGELAYPKTNRWYTAAGGAALACVFFFGIPSRRRGWRSMLGLLIFLVGMAGVGCGGGGGGNSGSTGTTPGAYTFTVTGTDSVTKTITSSATVTLNVQ